MKQIFRKKKLLQRAELKKNYSCTGNLPEKNYCEPKPPPPTFLIVRP